MNGANYSGAPTVYGVPNGFSADPSPGTRSNSRLTFGGASNNGGTFYLECQKTITAVVGALNDLWRFNANSERWSWLAENCSTSNLPGTYGQVGIAAPNNAPSARLFVSTSIESTTGNLYIFGGYNGPTYGDTWMFGFKSQQ